MYVMYLFSVQILFKKPKFHLSKDVGGCRQTEL